MWSSVLVCVCAPLLCLVLVLIDRHSRYKCLDQLKGPRALPLVGNALQMGSNPVDFLAALVKFTKEYGNNLKLWIGVRPFLFTSDVKMVECLLTSPKHIHKSKEYGYLKPWLGEGLLIANGQRWKDHRKMITPAFHFKLMETSVDVFHTAGDDLIKEFTKCTNDEVTDIFPIITRYTLDVILETAMGTSLKSFDESLSSQYVKAIKDQCIVLLKRAFSPWMQFDLLFPLSKHYQTEKKAIKIMHDFSNSIITKRREMLEERKGKNENEENDSGIKRRVAFLDLLLEATVNGEKLTDDAIREEVDTFMFAGHDTTATAVTFCLYELANNPEIQKKLYEEIRSVYGDKMRSLTMKELSELKYLENVIKEGIRKYPPVPFYARELLEDVYFDGMFLPKGLTMEVMTFSLHRDPELYPDPEKFDPDRFLPENQVNKSPYAFVPFSSGPRNCIGQKFAMLEMKVVIANVIHHFELKSAGHLYEPILSGEAVLKSANGVHIIIKKRK